MDLKQLGNEDAQAAGKEFTYEPADGSPGFKLVIAAANNKNYQRKFTKLLMAEQKKLRGRDMPADVFKDLQLRAAVGTVLLGWSGLTNGDNEVVFSEDMAFQILSVATLEVQALRAFIDSMSGDLENFATEAAAESRAAFPGKH